ncbi:MAG: 2-dehydropantoate 2-reductase [Peptococcaceae bacterium]|nr:2-dehydropantoate 2-reductase [Peptococcaceae bacterium]
MKIAVIGSGAMGSLFGAYLGSGGHQVTLVDVWAEHVEAVNKGGLTIEEQDGPRTFRVPAVTNPGSLGPQDLVIIFVKSYHTARSIENALNLFGKETLVLTLQNGLGNAEVIAGMAGGVAVLAGTTSHGATVLGPGRVRHAGAGETVIGLISGKTDRMEEIASEFTRCGLETRVTGNIAGLLWGKLLVNVGINALTAICGVTNGRLVEMENTLKLMKMLLEEGEAVARALGVDLPYTEVFEKVKSVAAATGANRSSMLQDMDRGRPTEIDYINGAVVREGLKAGVPAPCNRFVTLLVKALEEKNRK